MIQVPTTFQNHGLGLPHFYHVKKSLAPRCKFQSFVNQSHSLSHWANAQIDEIPYHVFTATSIPIFIWRRAISVKIHTVRSQGADTQSTTPHLTILKKALLRLPGQWRRWGGRLESPIFWPTSLGLTCLLPLKDRHKGIFLSGAKYKIFTAGSRNHLILTNYPPSSFVTGVPCFYE